jgi:hypothetical protein
MTILVVSRLMPSPKHHKYLLDANSPKDLDILNPCPQKLPEQTLQTVTSKFSKQTNTEKITTALSMPFRYHQPRVAVHWYIRYGLCIESFKPLTHCP